MGDYILTPVIIVGGLVYILIGIPTLVVCVIDILWAGPAAFISAREAEKYGYDPGEYAKKGALYSLLSFALWRSLMKVMHGEKFDAGYVRTGYMTLFVCWFVTVPFFWALFAMLAFETPTEGDYLTLIWMCVASFVWFASLWTLLRFHRKPVQAPNEKANTLAREVTVERGYIMPILLAKLSILVTVIIFALYFMSG